MPLLHKPTLRERLRPAELIGLSAILGVFAGLVILLTTREWWLAGIGFGVTFIVAAMTIALLALSIKPDSAELEDIAEQDQKQKDRK